VLFCCGALGRYWHSTAMAAVPLLKGKRTCHRATVTAHIVHLCHSTINFAVMHSSVFA
jgi:hypothetical protein